MDSIQEYIYVIIQSASVHCKDMQQIQLIQSWHLSLQWGRCHASRSGSSQRRGTCGLADGSVPSSFPVSRDSPASGDQSTTPLQVENTAYSYRLSPLWPVKMAAV